MSEKLAERTEIENNPIGLSSSTVAKLANELDKLVSSQFVLFHQYQKHHWLVEGPQFRDLHLYLEESYHAVHAELDAIAERLTVLGGLPTSSPTEQEKLSIITHEKEGLFSVNDMLQADMEAEKILAEYLRKIIKLATAEEDYGTETLLKQTLMKVEDRAHHLDHYLSDMSL